MKKHVNLIFLAFASLCCAQIALALDNNALYQWNTQDGTPTYSPDPPPLGVDYVVVDADLNPLPIQPPRPTAAAVPSTPAPAALPAPKKSIPKWKPIRYARDPSIDMAKRAAKAKSVQITETQQTESTTSSQSASPECQLLKRETQIMEDHFADTTNSAEMDQAILLLHEYRENYRNKCQ